MPIKTTEQDYQDYQKEGKGDQVTGPRMKADNNPHKSILPDFPKAICQIARREFPDAKKNTDAIVAYMYIHCPELIESQRVKNELTEDQWELIRERKASAESSVNDRLLAIMKKLDKMSAHMGRIGFVADFDMYRLLGRGLSSADVDLSNITLANVIDEHDRFITFSQKMDEIYPAYAEIKREKDGRPANF